MTKEETALKAYNECHEQIYNHALRVVKNVHDAEDIQGMVYKKILELDCAKYDESKKATFSSWVHTITNTVILDFFRTNHQDHYLAVSDFVDDEGRELFTFVASNRTNADNQVMVTELRNKIARAYRTLKPKYRKIAYLYFTKDLPYNEIADMLNVPMGTVKGMINRSRVMLQEALSGDHKQKVVNVQKTEVLEEA